MFQHDAPSWMEKKKGNEEKNLGRERCVYSLFCLLRALPVPWPSVLLRRRLSTGEGVDLARESVDTALSGGTRIVIDGELEDGGPKPDPDGAGREVVRKISPAADGRTATAGVFDFGSATVLLANVDDVASVSEGADWTPAAELRKE